MVQVTVVEETWQQQRDTAQQVPSPAKAGQARLRQVGELVHEGGSAVQCQYRHYEGCEAQPTANRGAKAQREGTPEYGHTGQQVDPVDRRTVIGQVADQRLELRVELGRGRIVDRWAHLALRFQMTPSREKGCSTRISGTMPRVGNSVAITSELATNSEPAQYSGWLPSALTRRWHQASTGETVGTASASASRVFTVETQTRWYWIACTLVPIRISAYRSPISR